MVSRRALLSLLLLGLLLVAGADESGDDDDETADSSDDADSIEVEQGSDGPLGASEFAQTYALFPDFPDKRFMQGQFVDVLCGFTNKGDKGFNVTGMRASLHSVFDPSMYLQNFSDIAPYTEVKMGEEGTLLYRFFPDPNLEPREYILALTVDYIDADKEEYRSVYFNGTIEMVESQGSADTRTFFGRILTLGFLGILGFGGYHVYNKYVVGKRRSRPVETAKPASDGTEWLQDVNMPSARRAGAKKASGKGK